MRMLSLAVILVLAVFSSSVSFAEDFHLSSPDIELTPGDLCESPDEIRYPEQIKYCKRDVSYNKKQLVMEAYMTKYSYLQINESNRMSFKIDHYIPLCMGGSNKIENLWPQYKTIYDITDDIEKALCDEMSEGSMTQAEAIERMKFAKNNTVILAEELSPVDYILQRK